MGSRLSKDRESDMEDDDLYMFGLDCPHCDEFIEVTNWSGDLPIFCPMCGVDTNEEYEEY